MSRKFIGAVAVTAVLAVGATVLPAGQASASEAGRVSAHVVQVAQEAPRAGGRAEVVRAQGNRMLESRHSMGAQARAFPWIVAHAVYLIVRFGIPWLIRYAGDVFRAVFTSQALRTLACRELRRQGNGWGWSGYCQNT